MISQKLAENKFGTSSRKWGKYEHTKRSQNAKM